MPKYSYARLRKPESVREFWAQHLRGIEFIPSITLAVTRDKTTDKVKQVEVISSAGKALMLIIWDARGRHIE